MKIEDNQPNAIVDVDPGEGVVPIEADGAVAIVWVNCCIVVPASIAPAAANMAAAVGPGGAGMFEVGLSPTGALPATHYVSNGAMDKQFVALLNNPQSLFMAASYMASQQEGFVLTATMDDAIALVDELDLSMDGPFAAYERLGLRACQTDEIV